MCSEKNHGQPSAIEVEAQSAAGPVILDVKWDTPISLHLTSTTVDVVYKTIAKLAGINVLIDPDYKPQKINFELQDINLRQAMEMIAMQSKTFWRPVSLEYDSRGCRYRNQAEGPEQSVMKTFYLKNAATAADLQEAAGDSQVHPGYQPHSGNPGTAVVDNSRNSRPDGAGPETATDIDKPKPEVVIDIMVLEVSKTKTRTIGTNPPTSASVTLSPSGGSSSGSSGSSTSGLTLDSFTSSTPAISR